MTKVRIIRNKYVAPILFISGLLIFSYSALRAYLLSITWDEAFSYLQFVRHEIFISENFGAMDANNHLLNTWLNILSGKVFNTSEFVLRLPSLLSHVLYIYFSYKLVKRFENGWLAIASFLILNLNPYLLDFFSLSRGYGLSLGLMIPSIYYLYAYITEGNKKRFAAFTMFFAMLAVFANFVAVNYFLVVFGLLLILIIYYSAGSSSDLKQRFISFSKASAIPVIICLFTLFIIVPIAFQLKEAEALFYGGNNGFWKDTVSTIINRSLYEMSYADWAENLAKASLVLVLMGVCGVVIVKFVKKQMTNSTVFLVALLLLLGLAALSTIAQHWLLDTLYLMERTALFFVVLFNLVFVFFINECSKRNRSVTILAHTVCLLTIAHFAMAANFRYVLEWKTNADVKQMLTDLELVKQIPEGKSNVVIGVPLDFTEPVNFYRALGNKTWLNKAERSTEVNLQNDYLYLQNEQFEKLNKDSVKVIARYPLTSSVLIQPVYKRPLTTHKKEELDFSNEPGGTYIIAPEMEYGPGFTYIINDSLTPIKNSQVTIKAIVSAPHDALDYYCIVCSLENEKGAYMWKSVYLKDYIKKANNWTEAYYTCFIPPTAESGDVLKAYIWNVNKKELHLRYMELQWLNGDTTEEPGRDK